MSLASDYAESVADGFWRAAEDGNPFTSEDDPNADVYDFLANDALDINYVVGRDGDYLGADILLTCGGPNAWIHTRPTENDLVVVWDDRAMGPLPPSMMAALDEACRELWEVR